MAVMSKKRFTLTSKKMKLSKIIIALLAASAFAFSTNQVVEAKSELTTVYYVYLDDTYIGTVTDKEIVEDIVDKEIKQMEQANKNLTYTISSEITYIPEQVFRSTANNQQAAKKLSEELEVEVESAAIVINGNPVVHLNSKLEAEEVINQLKLQYVTPKQLKELEDRKSKPSIVLPALKENQTRIVDIRLTENVNIEEMTTVPKNILSPKQALKFLQKGTLVEKKYTVKDGDVLGSIAEGANLTTAQLIALNPGMKETSLIKAGQKLSITVPKPYLEVVVEKEVFKKETISFKTKIVNDPSMFKGEKKVKQKGKNGARSVLYTVSEQNGKVTKKTVAKETITTKPAEHIIVRGTKVVPSRGEGSFVWPASGGYVSSQVGYRWGKMHKGIDIARPSNYTIKAADNGTVVQAGWDGAYGNKIVIDHNNGFRTVYAHLSSIDVNVGQTVARGAKIGNMGSTGDSTGIHLHFEVYKNGSLQNAMNYLK
ncbi:peptidase M23 [Bacillus sp. FJAT-18017]|uniref:M23 family metallopeptidase n=1 Tax=Bacillus sp. FJAT-18017 TaxID=1705566 RepID=UPI0006BE030B|nr:M23 family metallopeptidase [Bacillus sp. FJAT-18017]ALC88535.1 peptidase M23 [Bacillus sp. FJAT-18017]